MNRKTYRILQVSIVAGMGGVLGWSFAVGFGYLPFIALIIGTGFMFILGTHKPQELEGDERTRRIGGKAASATYQVFTLTIAVLGLYFKTLAEGETSATIGNTLLYSACSLVLLFLVFYSYYNRKGE